MARGRPFTLDVETFRAAARRARAGSAAEGLREALAFYAGELLPECYDDWIVPERERLAEEYRNVLQRLVDLLEQQGAFGEAIVAAQSLVRHDPLREHVWRQLLRLHALNGDRAGIARTYRECKAVLKRELDVEPSAETEAAYEQWKRYSEPANGKTERLPGPPGTPPVSASPGSPPGNSDRRPGRGALSRTTCRCCLDRVRGATVVAEGVSLERPQLARAGGLGRHPRAAGGRAGVLDRQPGPRYPAGPAAAPTPPPLLALKGCMGGSKEGLLKDPDVQRILRERYKLSVAYEKMGSVDMLERCSAGYDFVWPGTEADVMRFKQKLGPNLTYETPLSSALVLYSWAEITDALLKQGVITQDANGVYSLADEARTVQLLKWLTEGKELAASSACPSCAGISGSCRPIRGNPSQAGSLPST